MPQSPGLPTMPATPTPTPNSDAVTAACEAALSDFLPKIEAVFKAELEQALTSSTTGILKEYTDALQSSLQPQTPTQARTNDNSNSSQTARISKILGLQSAFQQHCASLAANKGKEEAKKRIEKLYSSYSLQVCSIKLSSL